MTSENTLIGPDEPGTDWAALEEAVLAADGVEPFPAAAPAPIAAAPAPVPAAPAVDEHNDDEDDGVDEDEPAWSEVDQNADEWLWPTVLDDKGKPTAETARPNPDAMRAALHRAAKTSAADVDVLADAISEPEAREIIHTAADQRAFERELDALLAKRRAELASEGARRQAEHNARLAESRRRRENRAVAALERRDRALDPTSKIVRLAAAERWVPWIAVAPAILAAVLGAVNVGVNLDILSPHTQLINWMVEPLVTIPLIAILVAQILGAIGEGKDNPYRRLEHGLVFVAVLLNVGLHVYIDGWTPSALVWAIVPAGLAISANLVPRLIRSLRESLAAASVESNHESNRGSNRAPFRVAPATGPQAESAWTEPGPSQVSDGEDHGSTPERSRSETDLLVALADAVREGREDPGTGRAIDPSKGESIRRTLRVSKPRSRALRDAYAKAVAAAAAE
jgi:hypothetical protein